MTHDALLAAAERAVRIAKSLGADAAEAFVTQSEGTSINSVGGFAVPKQAIDQGIGIRVAVGKRVGNSGATGHGESVARLVATHALEAAKRLPESTKFQRFVGARPLPPPTQLHPKLAALDIERLSSDADALARRLAATPLVTYQGVSLSSWKTTFAVVNSEGVAAWDHSAGEKMMIEARVTRASSERTTQEARTANRPISEALDVNAFADAAVHRATAALDARPLSSPVREVILAPPPAAQVVRLFTPAFSARRVLARQSPLADRVGHEVAHERVTIMDLPHGPVGVHRQRVDHEGSPTSESSLVKAGRLSGFLHDSQTAFEQGCEPTGNGIRVGGVNGGVGISPVNLVMEAGVDSLDDIIARAERAVLVNEPMMGAFVANETTGDFSLVAPFAFLVENGKITQALPPTTVGGNAHKAMLDVKGVSRERVEYALGTFPHLHIGAVSCAT